MELLGLKSPPLLFCNKLVNRTYVITFVNPPAPLPLFYFKVMLEKVLLSISPPIQGILFFFFWQFQYKLFRGF